MKFGFCSSLKNAAALKAAGYDYIELPLAGSPENFDGLPIAAEAFNFFLPGDLKVVGEEADSMRQDHYLQEALPRAAATGAAVVVFGSGRSRSVPADFSRQDAERQVVDFLRRCGPVAAAHGVTIVIEPLNAGECNFINSVAEGVQIAQAVDHPAIQVLSDLYHVDQDGQSYEETRAAGPWLRHVHVAGAEERRAPIAADIDYLARYFRVLKEMEYTGRVSVEGNCSDIAVQAAETLDVLRTAWKRA